MFVAGESEDAPAETTTLMESILQQQVRHMVFLLFSSYSSRHRH